MKSRNLDGWTKKKNRKKKGTEREGDGDGKSKGYYEKYIRTTITVFNINKKIYESKN